MTLVSLWRYLWMLYGGTKPELTSAFNCWSPLVSCHGSSRGTLKSDPNRYNCHETANLPWARSFVTLSRRGSICGKLPTMSWPPQDCDWSISPCKHLNRPLRRLAFLMVVCDPSRLPMTLDNLHFARRSMKVNALMPSVGVERMLATGSYPMAKHVETSSIVH